MKNLFASIGRYFLRLSAPDFSCNWFRHENGAAKGYAGRFYAYGHLFYLVSPTCADLTNAANHLLGVKLNLDKSGHVHLSKAACCTEPEKGALQG